MDVGANTSNSVVEDYLCDRASALERPILGTFELTPTCNMNCNMCYVRMSIQEVNELGGLKPASYWIDLAKKAMKEGLLFLLITGGEPFLHPEFKEIFVELQKMGLFLTMNTNGTLIDENMAKFIHDHMIRRLNITIYGKDDETYERLCHNPHGFTQLSNAIKWLKYYDVPVRLNCSLTSQNYEQLEDFWRISEEWNVPIEISYYMFPPNRKSQKVEFEKYRMTPAQAAMCAYKIHTRYKTKEERKAFATEKIEKMNSFSGNHKYKSGFICRAANSSFWVNWKGNLTPCGILNGPEYALEEKDFGTEWRNIIENVKTIHLAEKCIQCNKQGFCPHCAAGEIAECGHFGEAPKYQCDFSDEYLKLLMEEIES